MPFTPAHAALVLPAVNRRNISATALIIGSVSPDFEYFFRANVYGSHGHTLAGIVYFDLPVTIFLGFVFHYLVKQNFVANLPVSLQVRLHPLQALDFKAFFVQRPLVVCISAMIGAASHIFWDAFTHRDGFFAQRITFYEDVSIPFMGVNYPFFYAAQHISTVAGLFILALYVYKMPVYEITPLHQPRLNYWLWLILVASGLLLLRFWIWPERILLGVFVVSSISALCLSVCLLGLFSFFRKPLPQSR
jgi:hypothetical protein